MYKKIFVATSVALVSLTFITYLALAKTPSVIQCNTKTEVKNQKTLFGASAKAWKCFSDNLTNCQPATIYGTITIKNKIMPIYYSIIGMENGNCHVSGPAWSELKDGIKGANCYLPDKFLTYADNGKDSIGYNVAANVIFERYSPDHIKYCLNEIKTDKCLSEAVQENKDKCYLEENMTTFSALACQKIKNSTDRDNCYLNISSTISAPEVCEKLTNKNNKSFCYDEQGGEKRLLSSCKSDYKNNAAKLNDCVMSLAFSKRDFSLCDQVSSKTRSQCFSVVAGSYFDPRVCDKYISAADSKNLSYCYNQAIVFSPFVKKDDCKRLGKNSTSCYYALALKNGDATLCDSIIDAAYKRTCKAKLVIDTSLTGKCLKLENQDKQVQCLKDMASGAKDANVCNDLFANTKNSTSITNELLGTCGVSLGGVGSADICRQLNNESAAGACLGTLALLKKDPSYCPQIKYDQKKIECINDYVKINKDKTMCDKYSNQQDGDLCYSIVGVFLKDKTLCNKIKDEVSKKMCNEQAW